MEEGESLELMSSADYADYADYADEENERPWLNPLCFYESVKSA
jgi:hypothetical protein